MSKEQLFEQFKQEIAENDIVIYMKGTKKFPQCGFSGLVAHIFQSLKADFKDVNVLADDEVRSGIKDFNNWPTVPQIFVKGGFIGGCDIIKEMFENGELQKLLQDQGII